MEALLKEKKIYIEICLDFGHFSDFIRLYRHVGYDFMFLALDKNAVTTDEQGVYELDKNWTKWTNGQKPLKHSMNASFRPLKQWVNPDQSSHQNRANSSVDKIKITV